MRSDHMSKTAEEYLDILCRKIDTRRLGTRGNREATAFFKKAIEALGYEVETQQFDCIHSKTGEITLRVGVEEYEASISPFTIGCDCSAELICTDTVEALEKAEMNGKILLIHGDLAKEQLMPKGFVFYNPEEHQHIYRLLEEKQPAAIITATAKNPETAGAIYPFPMIEDGDFDIPTAFMTDVEGKNLTKFAGKQLTLKMEALRVPTWGENIVARKGSMKKKIVFCAHIDTKENTPGALDNASGVVIVLLLAELLKKYDAEPGIEFVAFNGEEVYNTPGELKYLQQYANDFSSILLAVNMDNIGYHKGRTAYSFYGVPDALADAFRRTYANRENFFEGPPWYQSDHGIFMAKGVPAMAITEESVIKLMAEITHTEKDTPEIIDVNKLVENAQALADFVQVIQA